MPTVIFELCFFFCFIFFPAPNPGEGGNSEREGGLCHPFDSRCKGGFQNNRWVCLEGGVWKENKVGRRRGGVEIRGYICIAPRDQRGGEVRRASVFLELTGFFFFAVLP